MQRVGSVFFKSVLAGSMLLTPNARIHAENTTQTTIASQIDEINPSKYLSNSVKEFLKTAVPEGYELTSSEIIELYGWLVKVCTDADKLNEKQQEKFISEQVFSLKKTYKSVSNESLNSLTKGVNSFKVLRNKFDNGKTPKDGTIKHGELLSERSIISKTTQFAQAANMTTEQTYKLIELIIGNNKNDISKAIKTKLQEYETDSRARKLGERLADTVSSYKSPK